jgi:cytosine/adenosine deaminase-related metal-dependent hydrolase
MAPITNAHTHLELTDLVHLCPAEPMPFVRWMSRLVWHLQRRSPAQIGAAIAQGIAELKACGTTHVGDSSPDLDVRSEVDFARRLHEEFVDPSKIMALINQPLP